MSVQTILYDFFDEYFHPATKHYLYKDKQLLKANKWQEFADQQTSKVKKIVAMIPGILLFAYSSVKSFIQYGRISGLDSLIPGIFSFLHSYCSTFNQRILYHQQFHGFIEKDTRRQESQDFRIITGWMELISADSIVGDLLYAPLRFVATRYCIEPWRCHISCDYQLNI